MRNLSILRVGITAAALAFPLALTPSSASASGPVERLLQVIRNPNDASEIVLRFGAASEGLLFSRDGGHSFRALCTGAIGVDDSKNPLSSISVAGRKYKPTAIMDGKGKLIVTTFDKMWSDDGTGCSWQDDSAKLGGAWIISTALDPKTQELLAIVNITSSTEDSWLARSEVRRRTADGSLELVGSLMPTDPNIRALGDDLRAAPTETGVRLYASVVAARGPIDAPQLTSVVRSDDGGRTWTNNPLPKELEDADFGLLAVDPANADRVLGSVRFSDRADPLYLSQDGGKTFSKYGEVQESSGVTFAPDGRVFIGDAGDSSVGNRPGGVYTAASLGQPLSKVPASVPAQSDDVDCIDYDAQTNKLRICKLNRFGELNWKTGEFAELTQFEAVSGVLECEGKDIKATCAPQFNAGASWCCTGHYPFTDFCGDWDITSVNGRPVSCGLSGRTTDIAAGRGPTIQDAGAAAPPAAAAPATSEGEGPLMSLYGESESVNATSSQANVASTTGCALGENSGRGIMSFSLLLFGAAVVRRMRRKRASMR